jgi:hypothetical protein
LPRGGRRPGRFDDLENGHLSMNERGVMADRVPYLVNFPDQRRAVFPVELGRVAGIGTEILDGWVVDKIKTLDEIIGGTFVAYEVWVRPRLTS